MRNEDTSVFESKYVVKALVRFYYNHGSLSAVFNASGVPVEKLIDWLKTDGKISGENLKKLVDSMQHNRGKT